MSVLAAPVTVPTVVVAVDVGKTSFAFMVTDGRRRRLLPKTDVSMTWSGFSDAITRILAVLPAGQLMVKIGLEAAGHYHWPVLMAPWPAGWLLLELSPSQVAQQRRVMGRGRLKTDQVDLEAITELVLAGAGVPFHPGPQACRKLGIVAGHRDRRVTARSAVKHQLLAQLDRCFPGLTLALPDVLGTKTGRLVAEFYPDPARLVALGSSRFIRFGAGRGVQVRREIADRLIAAAGDALPGRDTDAAREVLAQDLVLLHVLEKQIAQAEQQMAALLPQTPFSCLISVPGWATVRVGNYGAAVTDLARWPGHAQLYRASGLSPAQYESSGKRRDGTISREGSVQLRRALIDLGLGLWLTEPAGKAYAARLRARGKNGGIIACAMAHRANRIAYAMVRDQATYDPARWT